MLTEDQLVQIERRARVALDYGTAVGRQAMADRVLSEDLPVLLVEVRRLRAMWLLEKSRADRAVAELEVLRPALAALVAQQEG